MSSKPRFLLLISAAVLLVFATGALALPEDREQPIHIESDRAESDQRKGITIYEGSVLLRQGTLLIKADKITVHTDADGQLKEIVAEGRPAHFEQQPEVEQPLVTAQARSIRYSAERGQVQLLQDAWLKQNDATMSGNVIDYDIQADIVKAEGQSGSARPRIEVVIPPQTQTRDNRD